MVTDVVDGDSLEAALRDFGPAAIEDLLPRLRVIAAALDEAHAAGQVHGALHPRNIFISVDSTRVAGLHPDPGATLDASIRPAYAAPEVVAGGDPAAASDQFALAAIAYEWLFGRRVSGPAVRPVEVRTLPGVDRDAMSNAFTRALAPAVTDRFVSCGAFCDALSAAVIPVLPLARSDEDDALDAGYFLPETAVEPLGAIAAADVESSVDSDLAIEESRFESFEPKLSPPIEPVIGWQPSPTYAAAKPVERFGRGMVVAALLVGMVVGFAAGYMARPRALQSGPLARSSSASRTSGIPGTTAAPVAATPGTEAALSTAPVAAAPAAPVPAAPAAPVAPGRLLVRSTPSGASVEVDGVARGVTPLALRDLELGSRAIAVSRRGYITEDQRVVLTRARPSRSVEVRLAAAAASAPRRGTPATSDQRPATVTTGSLIIESRPPGAAVTIDGQLRGPTPVTIDALAPGAYRVTLSLAGYQPFATTVRVVAGERTRAAASLSVQE